ncbi:KAP family P-loop NTPase fold protein [Brevundimonas nasdae]|uniref:KAP family NTPase n=1 Tax=Brevundimonas nasdae TaxID=172043 RepID=A0ABX8TIW2_9CAUL|nr:P-loop NTPase fold protein [Brevundimonas nasdae]QYC11131.1 KAP family NTPase [Brevundimonas nasdae]QYC13919.1 KAP family NTPase [Brevundimonas nasdae]
MVRSDAAEVGVKRCNPQWLFAHFSMPDSPSPTSDPYADIWADDLFSRRADADMLAAYIESIAGRPSLREDHKGFTISVDAEYGTGKSFFLKRFARHLSVNHSVAFVDAWSDDLADDPLTAIAATLKKALDPLSKKDKVVAEAMHLVTSKVGAVAKIVGKGIAKKVIALAITESVAGELLECVGVDGQRGAEDDLKDVASVLGDGIVDGLSQKSPKKLMADRIASFELGQTAIRDLKESLAHLVKVSGNSELRSPIVVIIDELDRCRPPYAIKLLEELKHLFDVPGVVFVLGLNSSQLSKSIKAAYGSEFDGVSYLRRFIDRQYTLKAPNLRPLVSYINSNMLLDLSRLEMPDVRIDGELTRNVNPDAIISHYMELYGLSARSAYSVGDLLQTCMAVVRGQALFAPVLLPYVVAKALHVPVHALMPQVSTKLEIAFYSGGFNGTYDYMSANDYFVQVSDVLHLDHNKLFGLVNSGDRIASSISNYLFNRDRSDMSSPANYSRLMEVVGRFS